MLKSPEPKLGKDAEELDAGWEEPVASTSVPPRSNAVSSAPVPATDELDDAWGSEPLVAAKPVARVSPALAATALIASPRAARSDTAPLAQRPLTRAAESAPADALRSAAAPVATDSGIVPLAPRPVATHSAPDRSAPSGNVANPTRRTLSKKERRELERQQRAHATRKGSERKQGVRAKRREDARRLAEEKQKQRAAERAAAEHKARQAVRRTPEKPRRKRAEPRDVADATVPASGTKRKSAPASPNRGRPQKYSGGGLILAIIALITLATGIYAWSKR